VKPRLAELVVCPIDRTPLELIEWETLGTGPDRRIETGLLVNRARRVFYPIAAGVPRLLVFPTDVVRRFTEEHASRIAKDLPEFSPPGESGMPGEAEVLRTFSSEWTNYEWDGRAYWNLSAEDMFRSMHHLLDLDRKDLKGKLVLEVGIGIGGIADDVARSSGCELVGIDLSYAVDAAYRQFGANPQLHIAQASAFALPFPSASFDYVYSQGVIHHTFSTRTAFESLSRLPKPGGRLYVWVYSQKDEQRSIERRVLMALETVLRPILSRLPDKAQTAALVPLVPLYMVRRRGADGGAAYGWREAIHAARDRFTPRYVHRHSEDEVMDWFTTAGYRDLTCVGRRDNPDWVPVSFTACTGVEGTRA
jgi:ubiquinone/menaquinone biosynthesis C-methylase UbiE/uncharacterized protein YbaR (Trm112 family)